MILLLALILAQPATLNLNQQPIESRQNGGRLSTQRQYAIDCRTNMTCTVDGGVLLLSSSGGGGGGGGAPVDGGYVVWQSVGSTNERVLSNGTNTTIDTATPGQIQVDLSGTIAVGNGGTGKTTITTNQVYVGTALDTLTAKTLPSCSNSTTSKLLYDNATQTFSCGTDQTGGGGGTSPLMLSFGGF